MSLKIFKYNTDYLQWSEAMNLIRKVGKGIVNYKDGHFLVALGLLSTGSLEFSDILAFKVESDIRCRRIYHYRD